jgi:hypothetical protein
MDVAMRWWFRRRRQRLELKFCTYAEADQLIRSTHGAWTIAPEEDQNRVFGMVYLERLEVQR